MPCKAFQGYELPAASWLRFFRTAYPAKVRNEIGICGIGLFHSNIGLSVIGSGLWVYTEDIRKSIEQEEILSRKERMEQTSHEPDVRNGYVAERRAVKAERKIDGEPPQTEMDQVTLALIADTMSAFRSN